MSHENQWYDRDEHTVANDSEWSKALAHRFKTYTIISETVSGINNTAYVQSYAVW
jgi:hypothetical protein